MMLYDIEIVDRNGKLMEDYAWLARGFQGSAPKFIQEWVPLDGHLDSWV